MIRNADCFKLRQTNRSSLALMNSFEKYCTPKTKYITYERYMFNTKKQDNETVDKCVAALRILAL